MAEINHPYQNQRALPPDEKRPAAPALLRQWWFRLIALLFVTEFIVPFILWQAGLPRTLDVFREAAAVLLFTVLVAYMLLRDKIPAAVLVILAISLIWGVVSIFDGQAPIVTFWGWWRLFKYPLLAVFAFLIPRWPDNFARWLVKFFVLLLAFQVGVQLLQFAAGQPPGDSLAGTFGWKGVAQYTMLVFLVVSIGFGHWLATGEWKLLAIVLVLGLVGTMLSVTKFYLLAAGVMGIVALVIHMVRGGRFRTLLIYVILAGLAAASFVPIYNNFIATTRGLKPLQEYLTAESINNYLFKGDDTTESGSLKLGRGYSVLCAWQQIQRDYTTFLFGYGIGGRTSSAALGIEGAGLEESLYGSVGSGLSSWILEYGLLGSLLFLGFNFWIMAKMWRHARRTDDRFQATLAYGLILFTLLWPMWLWYKKPWISGGMMMLYWLSLGYLFQQIYHARRPLLGRRPSAARSLDSGASRPSRSL